MSHINTSEDWRVAEHWRLWCRLCAKEDPQGNINVFFKNEQQIKFETKNDSSLSVAIGRYFYVQICRDGNLPKMLCTECYSLVNALVNFTARVSKVQQMFEDLNISAVDYHAARLKYDLLDENREHILANQPVKDVFYFKTNQNINELEEHVFETNEISVEQNPLEQPREDLKIKEENISTEGENNGNPEDNNKRENKGSLIVCESVTGFKEEEENILPPKRLKRSKNDLTEKDKSSTKLQKREQCAIVQIEEFYSKTNTKNNEDIDNLCQRKQKNRLHQKEFHCTQCSRVFPTKTRHNKHVKTHLPLELRKTIPCPYCESKFCSELNLEGHLKYMHRKERPFVCEECGLAVKTKNLLNEHLLVHTDYTPFVCEICKRGFKSKARLMRHMEIHESKKHTCPECGQQLKTRQTLKTHLLVHSNEAQHKCDYCGRAFKRTKALKNHLIVHAGLKPYSCNFCERSYGDSENCRLHQKKFHPEELSACQANCTPSYKQNKPTLEQLKAVAKTVSKPTFTSTNNSDALFMARRAESTTKGDYEVNSTTSEMRT